jgi:hypothetical protein
MSSKNRAYFIGYEFLDFRKAGFIVQVVICEDVGRSKSGELFFELMEIVSVGRVGKGTIEEAEKRTTVALTGCARS